MSPRTLSIALVVLGLLQFGALCVYLAYLWAHANIYILEYIAGTPWSLGMIIGAPVSGLISLAFGIAGLVTGRKKIDSEKH